MISLERMVVLALLLASVFVIVMLLISCQMPLRSQQEILVPVKWMKLI